MIIVKVINHLMRKEEHGPYAVANNESPFEPVHLHSMIRSFFDYRLMLQNKLMNRGGQDQSAHMRRLIFAFAVRVRH